MVCYKSVRQSQTCGSVRQSRRYAMEGSRMAVIDITANTRIPLIMELMQSVPNELDPHELVRNFVNGLNRAYADRAYIQISTRGLAKGEYLVQRILSEKGVDLLDHGIDWGSMPIGRGGIIGEVTASGTPTMLHNIEL